MHRVSRLAPKIHQAVKQTANTIGQTSSPSQALHGSGVLEGLGNRPVSTVATPTTFNSNQRVSSAGHVQLQPSANDLKNYPGLAPALGHSPLDGRQDIEKRQVDGYLNDGRPFSVTSHILNAKNGGDDKPLDPKKSIVVDHGDMTPAQAQAYLKAQQQPIFAKYETSGADGANCVHGHAKMMNDVLGHDVGHVPAHTMPQEMAEMVRGVKTKPTSE